MNYIRLTLAVLLCFSLSCGINNHNPPEYVKSLNVYKEGPDGLMVYFILADAGGAMTSADGAATLVISETKRDITSYNYKITEQNIELYFHTIPVERSAFHNTKIGLGAFQHDAFVFSVGRIPYSSFYRMPTETTGKAKLTFTTMSGKTISSEEIIIF